MKSKKTLLRIHQSSRALSASLLKLCAHAINSKEIEVIQAKIYVLADLTTKGRHVDSDVPPIIADLFLISKTPNTVLPYYLQNLDFIRSLEICSDLVAGLPTIWKKGYNFQEAQLAVLHLVSLELPSAFYKGLKKTRLKDPSSALHKSKRQKRSDSLDTSAAPTFNYETTPPSKALKKEHLPGVYSLLPVRPERELFNTPQSPHKRKPSFSSIPSSTSTPIDLTRSVSPTSTQLISSSPHIDASLLKAPIKIAKSPSKVVTLKKAKKVNRQEIEEILPTRKCFRLHYQVRVDFKNDKEIPSCRTIVISGAVRLKNLHKILLITFNLPTAKYMFVNSSGTQFKKRSKTKHYLSTSKFTDLCQFPSDYCDYVYAIGTSSEWVLRLTVEKVNFLPNTNFLPRCVDGHWLAPPHPDKGQRISRDSTAPVVIGGSLFKGEGDPHEETPLDVDAINEQLLNKRFGANATHNKIMKKSPKALSKKSQMESMRLFLL